MPATAILRARARSVVRDSARTAQRLAGGGLNLLFVPECVLCRTVLDAGDDFCSDCLDAVLKHVGSRCPRCGLERKTPTSDGPDCPACRTWPFAFDAVTALGSYDGPIRQAVLRLKHPHQQPLARACAELLADRRREDFAACRADLVIGVPAHWRRRLSRGPVGPELVADRVARRLGLPYLRSLVARAHNTPTQAGRSIAQRRRNVRGAFRLNVGYSFSWHPKRPSESGKAFRSSARGRGDARLRGAAVLVVDDVLTTGATCHELARVLKRGGASRVHVAVLARAEPIA